MKKKSPGRPNQGKTETIRKRAITVYLPNEELVGEWKSTAKKSGVSVSQFVLEAVERQRSHGYGESPLPKLELEKKLKKALKKIEQMEEKYNLLEAAYETREEDVKRLSELLDQKSEAPINFELARKLIEGIRNWPADSYLDYTEVIKNIGIDPKDMEMLAQIREIASFLEALGLLKTGVYGWDWKGDRKYPEDKEIIREKMRRFIEDSKR